MRVIIENTSGRLLIVEGFDIQRTQLFLDNETAEYVCWLEFKTLEELRLFVQAVGSALCVLYENEKRWGAHWPEEMRCMFLEVDDAPPKRVVVEIIECE